MFVLMLPSLIFGGLTSNGTTSQPILNDSAAITEHMDEIAAVIDEVLGEGVADAEARIAQDFATTDGDNYEVIQPSAITSNTNSFVGQYCAVMEQDWTAISLENMKKLLRNGKSSLYSFTRTSETRVVEADDPDTEDMVETREEKWYVYTLVYNGEAYFADQVFHLTDDQKILAENMSTASKQLYIFLSGCAGNWRNTIFIAGAGQKNSSSYLVTADRDGHPIVMTVEQFRQLTGEQIDPAECCGQLTCEGFKALYSQYLLWHMPSAVDDPLWYLSQAAPQ